MNEWFLAQPQSTWYPLAPAQFFTKENIILVGFVATLPLAGAAILWFMRRRAARYHWATSLFVSALSILGIAYLGLRLPIAFSFSNWQPAALFQAELVLSVDGQNWAIALAVATMPLSLFLTSPVRPESSNPTTRILVLAYTGMANIGILAANTVTTMMTWASTDILGFIIILTTADEYPTVRGGFRRFMAHIASVVMLMAGSVQIFVGSSQGQLQQALWLIAIFLRIGLWPLHVSMPSLPGIRRGLGVALRLLPPVMGMAFLARFYAGEFTGYSATVFLFLAGISVLVGGIRWSVSDDRVTDRPFFVLTLAGIAIAAAVGGRVSPPSLAAIAVITVALGTNTSQFVIYERWHRYVMMIVALLALGAPWTIGHLMHQLIPISSGLSLPGAVTLLLTVLGLAMLATGIIRTLETGQEQWVSGEAFVRNSYTAGLFVPILVCFVAGVQSKAGPTLSSGILFGLALGLTVAARASWNRWQQPIRSAILDASSALGDSAEILTNRIGLGLLRSASLFFRTLGKFLEGKAALLWVYVTLLVVALLLMGSTP